MKSLQLLVTFGFFTGINSHASDCNTLKRPLETNQLFVASKKIRLTSFDQEMLNRLNKSAFSNTTNFIPSAFNYHLTIPLENNTASNTLPLDGNFSENLINATPNVFASKDEKKLATIRSRILDEFDTFFKQPITDSGKKFKDKITLHIRRLNNIKDKKIISSITWDIIDKIGTVHANALVIKRTISIFRKMLTCNIDLFALKNNNGQTLFELALQTKNDNALKALLIINNDLKGIRTDHFTLLPSYNLTKEQSKYLNKILAFVVVANNAQFKQTILQLQSEQSPTRD
ncbi:MAG: hypothetical protein ACOYT8_04180 [Candidatus Dependentiae bacterium]